MNENITEVPSQMVRQPTRQCDLMEPRMPVPAVPPTSITDYGVGTLAPSKPQPERSL